MKLQGTIKVLSLKNKSFENDKGETIKFLAVDYCDDFGNKFSSSVDSTADLSITEKSEFPVEGTATFDITTQTRNGRTYPKFKLVEFK